MPIRFRCSACNQLMSIGTRKSGTSVACPKCQLENSVPVPEEASASTSQQVKPKSTKSAGALGTVILGVVAFVLLIGVVFGAAMVIITTPTTGKKNPNLRLIGQKAPHGDSAIAKAEKKAAKKNVNAKAPPTYLKIEPNRPKTAHKNVKAAPKPAPNSTADKAKPKPVPPAPKANTKPTPKAKTNPQAKPKPKTPAKEQFLILDDFGNPASRKVGLALDNEFAGNKILIWFGFRKEAAIFMGPQNPLWAALNRKGFQLRKESGPFRPNWLQGIDQLWILSSPTSDPYTLVSKATLPTVLRLLPAAKLPPGWTKNDLGAVFQASFRYPGGVNNLGPADLIAIERFVRSGKGLFLLAENTPANTEANRLGLRLFGSGVTGNYQGTRIAYVKQRRLSRTKIAKFGGQFAVDDHPILTGVNFMFEGVTVGAIKPSPKLELVMRASDGNPLIAVSNVPGQRVVLDCGYTRYYFGPTPASRYIIQTAGTIRFAENVAAYLMGKGTQVRGK